MTNEDTNKKVDTEERETEAPLRKSSVSEMSEPWQQLYKRIQKHTK